MLTINSRMPFDKQQSVCACDPAESTNTGFDCIIYLFTGWFLCQWIKLYDMPIGSFLGQPVTPMSENFMWTTASNSEWKRLPAEWNNTIRRFSRDFVRHRLFHSIGYLGMHC